MITTPTEPDPGLDWVALLLQTSDALFPTGSYAHSLGFEECVRGFLAKDEAGLQEFLTGTVLPGLATFELPYLRFARQAALDNDFALLAALDGEVGATRLARETRDASVQLGKRRLQALQIVLPGNARLTVCARAVETGAMAGHQVIVCGVQSAAAGIPLAAALSACAYGSLAATGSAALKLMRIGQDGVQRALRAACAGIAPAVTKSLTILRDDAGSFHPLLEIASMRHEHAGERLFIS